MRYRVWCPDHGQYSFDGRVIEAFDAREAVEKWADADDWESSEFSIVVGQSMTVRVCSEDDWNSTSLDTQIESRSYEVTGESVRIYTARELP